MNKIKEFIKSHDKQLKNFAYGCGICFIGLTLGFAIGYRYSEHKLEIDLRRFCSGDCTAELVDRTGTFKWILFGTTQTIL